MENLDKIKSKKLRGDLLSLQEDFFDTQLESIGEVKKYLYNKYVMGFGAPICICDVEIGDENSDNFVVYLGVDYRVTSGYKPYQPLDDVLVLKFRVNKEIKRDRKINKILCH